MAKQVLASSLYFHASFVQPPKSLLREIVDCIDRFVVWGKLLEGPVPPLRHAPSAAVESLPYALGGLQRADVPLQVEALQAKLAAMLLHPKRHPWKVLMRRAFERQVPGLGPAALVSQLRPLACRGRAKRLTGVWKALRSLVPHRLVEPSQLCPYHCLREGLASNCRIASASEPGGLRATGRLLKAFVAAAGWALNLTVGGLKTALASHWRCGVA